MIIKIKKTVYLNHYSSYIEMQDKWRGDFIIENKFTPEQIEKAKACKSTEELLTLAKENGIEMTEAEAKNYFAQLNPENSELSDDELEQVAGGRRGNTVR